MANTYNRIYIHVVLAISSRHCLIARHFRQELHEYIDETVRKKGQTLIAVNGMPDHLHLLLRLNPDVAVSDLVKHVKISSTRFVNEKGFVKGRFSWQEGYGAFSYSHSQLNSLIRYIRDEQSRHRKQSFKEEYLALLRKFNVDYDPKYLFEWI